MVTDPIKNIVTTGFGMRLLSLVVNQYVEAEMRLPAFAHINPHLEISMCR
jgi:hypothetical protein